MRNSRVNHVYLLEYKISVSFSLQKYFSYITSLFITFTFVFITFTFTLLHLLFVGCIIMDSFTFYLTKSLFLRLFSIVSFHSRHCRDLSTFHDDKGLEGQLILHYFIGFSDFNELMAVLTPKDAFSEIVSASELTRSVPFCLQRERSPVVPFRSPHSNTFLISTARNQVNTVQLSIARLSRERSCGNCRPRRSFLFSSFGDTLCNNFKDF